MPQLSSLCSLLLTTSGISSKWLSCLVTEVCADQCSWTRYKINRPGFERRYALFFDSIGRNPTNPKIDADTIKWIPLMFIVVSYVAVDTEAVS